MTTPVVEDLNEFLMKQYMECAVPVFAPLKWFYDYPTALYQDPTAKKENTMSQTKCPNCQREFRMEGDSIDALNLSCGASGLGHPEAVVNGYRIFFRGFIPQANSLQLVGLCVAMNERGGYVSGIDPADPIQEYSLGDVIANTRGIDYNAAPQGQIISAVRIAMKRLTLFVLEADIRKAASDAK